MPAMDDDVRQQALLTALTTEHFVLQTARSTTVSEANGRSSLYLTSVSSALVALGFVAQVGNGFGALAAAVLPALFILGEFTFVRLLEISIENMRFFRSVERIRRYYRSLAPEGEAFFGGEDDDAGSTWLMRAGRGQVLFTSASMVAAINSIILGAGLALLLTSAGVAGGTASASAGVLAALACFAAHVAFQTRQFGRVFPPGAGTEGAPARGRLPA